MSKIDLDHAHAIVEKRKQVLESGEPSSDLKYPRLYIGQMVSSKMWEVWLIGFGDMPQTGMVLRDIPTLDEALRVAKDYLKRHGHIQTPDTEKLMRGTV
jgi:hypothetical protein